MPNAKCILSVSIQRLDDDNPDTSWMGEYSDTRTSRFSIDRAHTEDCASQHSEEIVNKLERAIEYLDVERRALLSEEPSEWVDTLYDGLSVAQDTLIAAQDDAQECDCGSGGNWNNREYRYFNPSFNYVGANGEPLDMTADEVSKYTRQDYDRMEDLHNGGWGFIVIRAEAEITVNGVRQQISSGGLCGVESDSEDSDITEVEQEELCELRSQLSSLGFSKRAIASAFSDIKRSKY